MWALRGFLTEKIKGDKSISYLVCHMKKYHKTDIAPVEQENERDETYRASNPQIDCRRTSGNYHIVKRQRSYTQFINDKIEALDLPTKIRKDAVLMCSFVVGSDREFFDRLSPQEQCNSLPNAPASSRSGTERATSSRRSSTWTKPRRACT